MAKLRTVGDNILKSDDGPKKPDAEITLEENPIVTDVDAEVEKQPGPGLVATDGYETDVTESELALSSASSVASLHEDWASAHI